MPPAQRKLACPENSMPWRLFVTAESSETGTKKFSEVKRSLYIKAGVLTNAKGSAYLESGKTKIMAGVHPQRKILKQTKRTSLGTINCELKYDRCASVLPNKATVAKNEKYLGILLKKALEPAIRQEEFPNLQVDIVVLVLQDSGCVLSAAINCCAIALIDGGVPMFDTIVSSTAAVDCGEIVVSPELSLDTPMAYEDGELGADEEGGFVVLSQLVNLSQITVCFQKGYISKELLKETYKKLVAENAIIAKTVKEIVVDKVMEKMGIKEISVM